MINTTSNKHRLKALQQPIDQIAASLSGKKTHGGWTCLCPAHDDKSPSLSLSDGTNGRILFHCHAGCTQDAVIEALKAKGLWASQPTAPKTQISEQSYFYCASDDGNPHLKVTRFDYSDGSKTYRQHHLDNGVLKSGSNIKAIQPYKFHTWKEEKTILLVEGEKCADALIPKGIRATCVPKGANGWKEEYAKYFEGKQVVILPDNDEPGRKFAKAAASDISKVATVSILELPGLKNKEDVYDWLNYGSTANDLMALIGSSAINFMEWNSSPSMFKRLSDVQAKKAQWFWKDRIPIPGVTLLEGDGGIGKSYAMADIIARVTAGRALPGDEARPPINVLMLSIEDDPEVVLRPRFEAQGADCSRVFFLDQSFRLNEDNLSILDNEIVSKNIGLLEIDPVIAYFAQGDTNKSTDVREFINGLHLLSKKHGIPVVCIRHWNKNNSVKASQRGAGSTDFRNGSRSVLQVIKAQEKTFLALEKSNYAARAKTLSFSIVDGILTWGEESDLTADEIISMANEFGNSEESASTSAAEFIEAELAEGRVKSKELNKRANECGISTTTLNREKKRLGVKSIRVHDTWYTYLPKKQEESQHSQDTHTFDDKDLRFLAQQNQDSQTPATENMTFLTTLTTLNAGEVPSNHEVVI